ncbi:uncharacterized protein LOC110367344 [Fundulus heteroclitus]|uniref:uncharacterized protein LOC110367344 n=1 Tax=Fundulus heteroclitus TaxID=8078 RepID=UPI00079EE627|nr:uncharacterized protein LOC110367344 [Fundulus heteroclitus]
MQFPMLIYLRLMLILLTQTKVKAKDEEWAIVLNRTIHATKGTSITILCKFSAPEIQCKKPCTVYWKTEGTSECAKNDNDKKAFAFHPNASCIDPRFRNRTQLIGDTSNGNCSLQISDIQKSEPLIYLRVTGFNDSYSFVKHKVRFNMVDQKSGPLNNTDSTFESATESSVSVSYEDGKIKLYLATFLPLLGLIVIVAGTVAYKVHKRSYAFKGEESGYYANFKHTSSNPPKSEPCRKTSNKELPDPKVIDEPVYMNCQTLGNPTDQQVECVDNVYGNVDYTL